MPKAIYKKPDVEAGDIIGRTIERSEAEAEGLLENALAREPGYRKKNGRAQQAPAQAVAHAAHTPVNEAMAQQILQAGGVRCASCNGAHFVEQGDVERLALQLIRQDPDFMARAANLIQKRSARASAIREQVDEELSDVESFKRDPADFSAPEKAALIEEYEATTEHAERIGMANREGVNWQQLVAWVRKKEEIQKQADAEAAEDFDPDLES